MQGLCHLVRGPLTVNVERSILEGDSKSTGDWASKAAWAIISLLRKY
jgi:hypothetical protein